MNTLSPALLSFPALLLAACSFEPTCHARIHRLAPGATAAAPVYIPMEQEHVVHHEEEHGLPCADHASFTCQPNYPRTFRVWKDEAKMQAEGPRRVEIDLARQRGIFVVNDEVAMDFPVCTGKKRKPTPTGQFRITQKNVHHHSNIYDVPMPYFMRLTNGGIGMHVGDVFRTPASHGCIRLTREACIPLFRNAPSGTRVVIRSSGWSMEQKPAQLAGSGPEAARVHEQLESTAKSLSAAQARQLANAAG